MNALERLLLEEIPTRPAPAIHSQWTKQEQDRHWEDLADGLGIPCRPRPEHPPTDQAAA
ncbi:hypothetical protein AB0958_09720 [Streptomyces sp. NPDC006655]|uniref:hypothetical protein n=1 Tax=Streptomyces sp. NPDC006655 TaxID=3156898 RepID=UPI003454B6BB